MILSHLTDLNENIRWLIRSNDDHERWLIALSNKIDNRTAEILQRLKNLEDAAKAQRNTDY